MAEKAKYIDVKELSIILDVMRNPDSEFVTDDYIDGFSDGISAAIKELKAFPTADVAPVRHGRWINENFYTHCSACGKMAIYDKYGQEVESDYCPHCGVKMDGGD